MSKQNKHCYYRSFLKWPGQKQRLLHKILPHLDGGERLVDCFVGSGSIFINSDYDRYLLADLDPDLMGCYQFLKECPDKFIAAVEDLFAHPDAINSSGYYSNRDAYNNSTDLFERSSLLVFLSRHSFNGLVRRNKKNKFNTPYGHYGDKVYFPEKEFLLYARKLKRAQIYCGDFTQTLKRVSNQSDLVADPPYLELNKTSSFKGYMGGFATSLHEELGNICDKLASRGNRIVVCNHDVPEFHQFYRPHRTEHLMVQRSISAKASSRIKVPEILGIYN